LFLDIVIRFDDAENVLDVDVENEVYQIIEQQSEVMIFSLHLDIDNRIENGDV
jgi:hypothetical protein